MALAANQQGGHRLTPTVFIGCSSAALKHAERIKDKLCAGGETDAKVWTDKLGDLGGNILDDLLRHVSSFDFAVLILGADDLTSAGGRGKRTASPRDNVIFELGLFMGVRGRRRAFTVVLAKRISDLKIPSDLAGNTVLLLDPDKLEQPNKTESDAYLSKEIERIRESIRSQSASAALSLLPSAALASGYFYNFILPVYSHLKTLKGVTLAGETYQLSRGNYKFVILLPRSLEDFGTSKRDEYVENNGLLPYSFSEGERRYGFFVYPPQPGEVVRFADYPTTLRSSAEIINRYLQEARQFGLSDELLNTEAQMQKQEIRNFHKALEVLISEKRRDEPNLQQRTEIRYID